MAHLQLRAAMRRREEQSAAMRALMADESQENAARALDCIEECERFRAQDWAASRAAGLALPKPPSDDLVSALRGMAGRV